MHWSDHNKKKGEEGKERMKTISLPWRTATSAPRERSIVLKSFTSGPPSGAAPETTVRKLRRLCCVVAAEKQEISKGRKYEKRLFKIYSDSRLDYTEGAELVDAVLEVVRKESEGVDCLQGMFE